MSSLRFVTLLSNCKHLSFQVAVFNWRAIALSTAHKHIDSHPALVATRLISVLELRQLLFIVALKQLQEWVLVYAALLLLQEKLDLILTSFIGQHHAL